MIEYTTEDKSTWNYGQDEPDKVQYVEDNYNCLIVRNQYGALCGYVGVHAAHPFHGKHYSDIPNLDVHGGITYSDGCQHSEDPSKGICHIPAPGEPDDVWWFGFDCAHAWDICPKPSEYRYDYANSSYKNIGYVKFQIFFLVQQLKEYETYDH